MTVWDGVLRLRVPGSLLDLARVARNPRLYATAANQARGLVDEFMEGGVAVDTCLPLGAGSGTEPAVVLRTVVQGDGDVQVIVDCSLRDLPAGRQEAVIVEHFAALEAQLAPLSRMAELTRALRAAWLPAGGLGIAGSGMASYLSGTMDLWILASVVPSILLFLVTFVGPRLLWWWLRGRMARQAQVG